MFVNVNKKITFQGCRLHWSSSYFIFTDKTKSAKLALMYCGEFVKTLIGPCYHRPNSQLKHLKALPSHVPHFKIPMGFSFLRRCLTSNRMLVRSGGFRVFLGVSIPKVVALTYYFANVLPKTARK